MSTACSGEQRGPMWRKGGRRTDDAISAFAYARCSSCFTVSAIRSLAACTAPALLRRQLPTCAPSYRASGNRTPARVGPTWSHAVNLAAVWCPVRSRSPQEVAGNVGGRGHGVGCRRLTLPEEKKRMAVTHAVARSTTSARRTPSSDHAISHCTVCRPRGGDCHPGSAGGLRRRSGRSRAWSLRRSSRLRAARSLRGGTPAQ